MNVNSYTPSGPGVVSRHHRNSTGSLHQTTTTTFTPNYVRQESATPLTAEHPRTQAQHSEHPYHHHWEQERLASAQHRAEERPALYVPLPLPVAPVPPAPRSAPDSFEKARLSHPPPSPQLGPMDTHPSGQAGPRWAASAATIPTGQDHRNRSLSQPVVTNAMPPQVAGLNFQYDQNGSYRAQHSHQHSFIPNLPLSQPTGHVPFPSHPTRPPTEYVPAISTQTRMLQPSSQQNPTDLSHPMPPPVAGQPVPQSVPHPGRPRQNSLCSPFCPPNCATPHTGPSSPATLTFQPGNSPSAAPPPIRRAPSQGSEPRSLHGHTWGPIQPAVPPPPPPNSQQRPVPQQPPSSLPSRQSSLPHQVPSQQPLRPPSHSLPPQQHMPPQQPRPPQPVPPMHSLPQQFAPPQPTQPYAPPPQPLPPQQPAPPQQQPQHPQRRSSQSTQPTSQPARPISAPARDDAVNGSAAASAPGARLTNPEQFKQAQAAIHNDALMAALRPLQGGVEQLWSHTVNQFSTVLNQVLSCQLETIQTDRATMAKLEAVLKEKQDENLSLLEQRAKLAQTLATSAKAAESMGALIRNQDDAILAAQKETERMGVLIRSQGDAMLAAQKETENMGALIRSQADAILAAQEEVTKLVGEKSRLEVEISSVRDVRHKIADSGTTPSAQLVTILLQQEIALQVEKKLREAHKAVEEHRIAREQAEKQLSEMKQKLKALVGFDIGEIEKHPPSREATVVGTPPPKSATHSRRPSKDIPTSPLPVTPLPPPSLPPISAPSSPMVLRAAPPIQRRPSPRPHLPTPSVSASVLTSIPGKGTSEETSRSTSVPSRPTPSRNVSTPVPVAVPDENAGVVVGVKRPRPGQFDQDSGEPVPVRRLTVDSEGPRRDGLHSRDGSAPPSGKVPAPPIASMSTDGRPNEAQRAMDVDRPQQPLVQSPAPAPAPPTPAELLSAAIVTTIPDPTSDGSEDETMSGEKGNREAEEEVMVKFEEEVDQLMEELVNFDDEPEEGEVLETDQETVRSSPVPQAPNAAASEPLASASHSSPSLPPKLAAPPSPPGWSSASGQQQRSGASPYVPPARPWAQSYPSRPPQNSASQSSPPTDSFPSCLSKPVKEEPGAPKLSVMKHWVLLYVDDGTEWKCRLCQTMPNPGRPRAVFDKKTNNYEAMLQHSQTEHPVACVDMAKLSNDKLAEMKARLPPQGCQ